ncbi:hypothetical protein [Massilia aurea]|uniref:hypothetical protein n=1 Tax=Massilia aurea TaxID=373040 RepID=UPI0011CE704B|nr:hypothetical protein [Massilia aurea]
MANNTIDGYLDWITPKLGDPTYSLLKAHLLFEELLRSYLGRVLPHASALEGSRLTFVQLLAVARASSTHVTPDHWIWKAIGDLNKLRNLLSHETRPKALKEKIEEYQRFVVQNTGNPLPDPQYQRNSPSMTGSSPPSDAPADDDHSTHLYSSVDLVTVGLYYATATTLGYNVETAA